ncbi:hypothetical protein PM082_017928 [Marasmius tenuissimus]|nr:hypothetical protein PM082_017928 [Marasmius tenuissimus]
MGVDASTANAYPKKVVIASEQKTKTARSNAPVPRNPNNDPGDDPAQLYINHEFLSSHFVWSHVGKQGTVFLGLKPAPTNRVSFSQS